MDDLEKSRFERELSEMKANIKEVRLTADHAANSISTHEQVCALRYQTITHQLQDIPKIFAMVGNLQKHVYIGVGLVLAAGAILKVIH